jgi:uncharacterized protein YegL
MEKKLPSKIFQISNTLNNPQVNYNDDEPISVQTYAEEYKMDDSLRISMKFCFDYVQLSSVRTQEIPACLFLETGTRGSTVSGRPGVDIVFVIDISGSMMGPKLELVKKTLEFMISKLSNKDRVSLVTFNNTTTKLLPLICANDPNKAAITRIIENIKAYGGTEIVQGLDMGLKILAGRKISNSVSSIVLLSDGKDNNSHSAMPRVKEILIRSLHEIESGFSIHTFGYGGDHDAKLLNAMAEEKNGGFYFVEKEETIPIVFSNCLGELISVIADNIQVNLSLNAIEIPCEIGKIYSETSTSSFRMPPVLSGDVKEAVFILKFLPFDARESKSLKLRFGTHGKIVVEPIKAIVSYKIMKTGRCCCEEINLSVDVYPEDLELDDIQLNADVMINFYRLKASDVMKEASALADRRNIQGAREVLTLCIEELRSCIVYDSDVLLTIVRDLQEAVSRLASQASYEVGGRADMLSKASNHMNKRASGVGSYQNHVQTSLNTESLNWFSKKK